MLTPNISQPDGLVSPPAVRERFLSLDVFRGLTVAGMILVNNPGNWLFVFAPLRHASWNGCTPTDLVFPFFLFAVGNALAFSRLKYQMVDNRKVIQKIIVRAMLIFTIGIFLNWFPFVRWHGSELEGRSFENLRIFGVLQRIALAYMAAALLIHVLKPSKVFICAISLLVVYWIVLLTFGDLTLEGNAVLKLDRWLLGEAHLYRGYFSTVLSENIVFDPEGLLSTIPAISSVIFGYMVGKFVMEKGTSYEMLSHLLVFGALSIFAGQVWGLQFPINKPIWSGAYVLYTTGLAMVVLSVMLFFIEMKGQRRWATPFLYFGKNPLFIYVLSGVWVRVCSLILIGESPVLAALYANVFRPLGEYTGSLLFAIAHVLLFLLVGWWLDKKQIYVKV
jgi:predicted acyltransferase